MRFICIGVHFFYLSIQCSGFILYNKTNKRTYLLFAYISAVVLHIAWNNGVAYFILIIVKNFV